MLDQSLRRVWESVGNHKGPPWYYLLEILESAWPWQLFWLLGLRQALENRNFAWGKISISLDWNLFGSNFSHEH